MSYDDKLSSMEEDINQTWDKSCMPAMIEYLKIPNQSPNYDKDERTNGLTEKAFQVLIDWAKESGVEGMTMQYMEEKGRTPFLLLDIAATDGNSKGKTLLMYGHMDKQPPMDGWAEGLGPYTPVEKDGKLYGRGGADDGYAIFGALLSVRALQKAGIPHGHIAVMIEACEESGSFDLDFYIEKSKATLGEVDLVVCLDSGTLDYETMWSTTSLRGVVGGKLTVSVLKESMHSGLGSGIAPDAFRVLRMVLAKIEDPATGEVTCPALCCELPEDVKGSFDFLDDLPEKLVSATIPFHDSVNMGLKESELALRNTWKPTVTVVGQDGLLPCNKAGNVLYDKLSVLLSVRLPPTVDPDAANEGLRKALTADPPYGAKVKFEPEFGGPGWKAPALQPWCGELLNSASLTGFKKPLARIALGGSIPFMGMLGAMFPSAQFCITGILGPQSNAHGPNEFLHISYTKKLILSLTRIVAGHHSVDRNSK
eukprot:TRINITY_DN1535_c0_g1_i1.p1 TRINITY_DN1535_c0_g1~~TRINITY_DN1535_c0_g1_i1.p1  ORF type:complete len:503 (+),score=96.00 TRINITY_DN1535_c0_g1_i1:67-1509(+)